MAEETVAASSPAETADPFNGEQPTLAEFSQYRESGELPARFKAETADSASAEDSETPAEGEQPESAPESDPDDQQPQPKPKKGTAEDRIAQLEATIEKIRRGAGLERKTDPAPVAQPQQQAPPQAPPQTYQEWERGFSADKWIEEYAKSNPEATYERANAAMFSHMLNVRDQFRDIEAQRRSQATALNEKVTDARARYGEKFDDVVQPTLSTILADPGISPTVKAMMDDSEVIADLLYTIGSDEKSLNDFVQMAKQTPGKALRYIAALEAGIVEQREVPGKVEVARPRTSAPKPPTPVGGTSSRAFDVRDESLSADEWMRKRNAELDRRK